MKVYPMSPVERKELNDFLEENLSSGRICPLKSLMVSLVFFMKKMGNYDLSKITKSSMQ